MNRLSKYFDNEDFKDNSNIPVPEIDEDESEDKPRIIILRQILDAVRAFSFFVEGIRLYTVIDGKEFSFEIAEDKHVSLAFDKMAQANMPPHCSRVILEGPTEE